MIVKVFLAFMFLVLIPELLGLIITKYLDKEKNNLILAFILGYLIEFAICQLFAVPLIFMEEKLTTLLIIYILINLILSTISIKLNFKQFKEMLRVVFEWVKTLPKLLTVLAIILIGIQTYGLVGYMHLDDDDAFYVASAVTAVDTNSIYKYSPATGEETGDQLNLRYRLGPFPVYYAIISKIICIHPTIVAHTILPAIFIPIAYMILAVLAKYLFKDDKENIMLFLIFMSVITIWGNYSRRNNFSFLLFRIWQGKGVLANMIIPAVWLLYFVAKENGFKKINYISFIILIMAGCLTTTMGIALPTITLILLSIADQLSKFELENWKKFDYKNSFINIAKCFGCCLPAIVYVTIYFLN